MAVALRRTEESIAAGILGGKTRNEIRTDLVIALPDHWAERGANVVARGAEPLHCRDRRLGDTGKRAAPASVRGAHHPSLRIGEEDGPAIGRRYADGEAGCAGDDGVGTRT